VTDIKELFWDGVSVVVFFCYREYIMTHHSFMRMLSNVTNKGSYHGGTEQYAGASSGKSSDQITKGGGISIGTMDVLGSK
jgi:hypothetical protein